MVFKPGNNMNPSGRSPEVQRGQRMLDVNSAKAVGRLVELMGSKNETVSLAATREILDRVYGKPKVSVDIKTTDVAALHLQYLQEIQQRREAAAKVIEHAPAAVEGHTESPMRDGTAEGLV